jgi:hypothetical protein
MIKQLPVPIPPACDQKQLVDMIDDHMSVLDAVLDSIDLAKSRTMTLRRSVFANAFSGRLTNHADGDRAEVSSVV